MKITITQDEAREFSRRWLETALDKNPQIELLPTESVEFYKLDRQHKIELIKFARKVAEDVFNNRIAPSSDRDGHLFFNLNEAKKYVETCFGW